MFGYVIPPAKPKDPRRFIEETPFRLVFCHVCGCSYMNDCPKHAAAAVVKLAPGDRGFIIPERR